MSITRIETYTSVYWLCSSTGCKSRVTTSVKGELISKLPTHDHGNNLLKRKAERFETDVINHLAKHTSEIDK